MELVVAEAPAGVNHHSHFAHVAVVHVLAFLALAFLILALLAGPGIEHLECYHW